MADHGERRSAHDAALRAVQRTPAKPWRGAGGAPLAPPKVYRVEPRDFRELVQRLTGAGAAGSAQGVRQQAAPAPAPVHAVAAHAQEQFDYASWFATALLSPASGFDGRHGNGALL